MIRASADGKPVCECGVYNFPHRPGGGKCKPEHVIGGWVQPGFYVISESTFFDFVVTQARILDLIPEVTHIPAGISTPCVSLTIHAKNADAPFDPALLYERLGHLCK